MGSSERMGTEEAQEQGQKGTRYCGQIDWIPSSTYGYTQAQFKGGVPHERAMIMI